MEITDVNTRFGAFPAQHPNTDPETLAQAMNANGVAYCLTLSTQGLFYHAAEGNADTMRACRAYDHLIPVATLNPTAYWGQPETMEGLHTDGFEMTRFFPREQGWPLDFAPFALLLKALARLPSMPVMVGIREPGDLTQLARIAGDYPHPVIVEGVSPATLAEAVAVLRGCSQFYVETHALRAPDALPLLRDTVGIDRVLFGSDAPGLSLSAALRFVRQSALSESDQNAVLGGNTQRIWHSGAGEE